LESAEEKLINVRRGEGGEELLGGPLWSPAKGCLDMWIDDVLPAQPHPTGDHKGPPPIHSTALAPTESSTGALVDAYWAILKVHRPST
jgi:hypothetical protein